MVIDIAAAMGIGAAVMLVVYRSVVLGQTHRERKLLLARLHQVTSHPAAASTASEALFLRDEQQLDGWWKLIQRTLVLQGSERLLEQAGVNWGVARLIKLSLAGAVAGAALAPALSGAGYAALPGFVVGAALPSLYVRRVRSQRRKLLEQQLPEAIDLLGRAIRAGHALGTGFRLVAEESPEPIAAEFRRTFEEQKYGMPFEESLHSMTRRVPLIDLRVLVVAFLIQREVGGNLAEILDKLSHLVRTRFAMRRQLMVHTAQGRLSGVVLGFMPLGLGGVISLISPSYVQVLFHDPLGKAMLGAAVGLQLAGYVWIWRTLKIDL